MISSQLKKKKDSVWKIITEYLGMQKACIRMMPRLLNDDQKEHSMQVCQERFQTEPDLLCRVIAGDETWIFEYDTEKKRRGLQQKSLMSPRPKKARQSK